MNNTLDIDTAELQAKRQRKLRKLRAKVKALRDDYIAELPVATDAQLQNILDKLSGFQGGAMKNVNVKFRLSDVQMGELELHLVDVEDSLNTDEGKNMVRDSLANAQRIKSFVISKARKGKGEKSVETITARAAWIV